MLLFSCFFLQNHRVRVPEMQLVFYISLGYIFFLQTIYQLKKKCKKDHEIVCACRWFVAVTASGTTWGLLGQPEAQTGKRRPPPPVEKKVEEDKGLSAYDQKLSASTHRKEALRLSIEGQKGKGKSLARNP